MVACDLAKVRARVRFSVPAPQYKYNMQKYNLNIPGWMLERELKILSELAKYVPENGSILEVGCFLGSSTTALYRGKHPSVKMDVVDSFTGFRNSDLLNRDFSQLHFTAGNKEVYELAKKIVISSGWQKAFKFCIGEEMYNNINVYPNTSAKFVKSKSYDLTFIDASHTLEDVMHDIKKFDSDEGLLIGDDYHPWYDGVAIALSQTRDKKMLVVFENTKLWALIPKSGYWRDVFKNNNLLFLK